MLNDGLLDIHTVAHRPAPEINLPVVVIQVFPGTGMPNS